MASQVMVAIERDNAIARINAALEFMSQQMGHEYTPIPTQGRDQGIVNKNQLVYVAATLEALLGKTAHVTDTAAGADVAPLAPGVDADMSTADTEPAADAEPVVDTVFTDDDDTLQSKSEALKPKAKGKS